MSRIGSVNANWAGGEQEGSGVRHPSSTDPRSSYPSLPTVAQRLAKLEEEEGSQQMDPFLIEGG